jgi:O-antigen/teichoic acid export membrane protein
MNSSGDCRTGDQTAARQPRWLFLRAVIARNITLKLSSEVVARTIQFAFIVVAARRLGPQGFGTYSFAVALGFVLAQCCDLGLQLYVARELASVPGRRSQILGVALWCKLALLVISIVFLGIYIRMRAGMEDRDVLFILALAVILTSQLEFLNYAFRGYQRLEFEAGLILVSRILGPGLAMPFLLWGASLRVVAWNLLLANVAAMLLGFHWLTRYFTVPDLRVSAADLKQVLAQVLPLGIAILSSALYTRMGILLLTRLTSLDNAGLFNAALRLIEPLQLIPAIALSAIYPAFAGEGLVQQRLLSRRTLAGLAILGLPPALGGWLGASAIVAALYGPAFGQSAAALRCLAPALVPMFLNYALTHFIIARGRPWLNASFTLAILIENLLLNLWFIPRHGVAGAALSVLISELTFLCMCALGYRFAMRMGAGPAGARPYGPHDLEGL